MLVVGEEAVAIVAETGPLIWLHAPVPAPGVLAAMVAEPEEMQVAWLLPAFAVVGVADTDMVMAVDVAVGEVGHVALVVITTRIRSPLAKSVPAAPV